MPASPEARLTVEVVFAWDGRSWAQHVELEAGADVDAALGAAREVRAAIAAHAPQLLQDDAALAVHGRSAGRAQRLREGDRVEIVGPLKVDPKEARRRRAAADD
ncbi:RnfH family protein [Coralloluteibacterium stylophorae]|uniref:UPF0125 protein KB893_002170 n=2 Tax=Coralloluteibacterium stylophorae TaxID=1776034 RepID=A0AAP2FWJ2_9GAMM|nr:RnfH family protein [Coralloluteibacterium stylophorae]MBS7455939.1 RnfH family protein [Coralloluteibacterium stylophorae]